MQDRKQKKVYCYISPRVSDFGGEVGGVGRRWYNVARGGDDNVVVLTQQIQVKEFYMRVIPLRVYTCKVCPSTKVTTLL